jgi:stage II sporulation protein D
VLVRSRALPACVLGLALLGAGALPAGAEGKTVHVIRGAGFGHGIGMSQWGAYGFAERGRSYREILAHYYRGTELSKAAGRTIRVLLQSGVGTVSFKGARSADGKRLNPRRTYRATRYGLTQVELRTTRGTRVGRFDAPLVVRSADDALTLVGTAIGGRRNGTYRGFLEIRPSTFSGLVAVNAVGLDDYVRGVIPSEVPASWPEEALKAQAVAARTYALATDAGGAVFDQYPDTRSQVYGGRDVEQPATNAAAEATAGEVLRHDGEIATTYFFSTSGGRTENVENVFYGSEPKPYLVSVEDPYDDRSPRHRWRLRLSQATMQRRLGGLVKGRFRRIKVTRRGESPRIVWASVEGTRGRTRVRGMTLRARLGLYDTWASFSRVTTKRSLAARVAGGSPRLAPLALEGTFEPRPRGGAVVVERRTRRGWRRVGRARVGADGSFRAEVRAPGVYRVRDGAVAGPAVTLR